MGTNMESNKESKMGSNLRTISEERVFHADIKVFFSKLFYQFLEFVVLTFVVLAVVLVAAYIIPGKGFYNTVFLWLRRIIIERSPIFPFSTVLFIEFFFVLLRYVLGTPKSDCVKRWCCGPKMGEWENFSIRTGKNLFFA